MSDEPTWYRPPNLSERLPGPELMDDESKCTPEELASMFDELAFINDKLGGVSTSLEALDRLHDKVGGAHWRIADVGGGDGELAKAIVQWGRVRGVEVEVVVVENSRAAVERARRVLREVPEAVVHEADLMDLATDEFDVVHACLVLHHFDGDEAQRALAAMSRAASKGIVVNDLRREVLPWLLIHWLSRLLSKNRLVRHDGPLSVARAFRLADWARYGRELGLQLEVRPTWAFRWAVVGVTGQGA